MTVQDLSQLPPPDVVEALSFEAIVADIRADLLARYPAIAEVIDLESEPAVMLLESFAYRELLYRQRVNDAARSHLLAYAEGSDLDHKGAFYGVPREPGEKDPRYRRRIQLRIRSLAGSGTAEHYQFVAMTASPNVRDATATQPEAGAVRVLLWLTDATQAAATVAQAEAALNAPEARPLGIPVSVAVARPRPIDITARIVREASAPLDILDQLRASMGPAMADYARLGRAVPRSWVTARLHVAGVAAVTFPDAAAPAESTTLQADEYPVLGVLRIDDGGIA
ncbi:baseplate J/gp47 family protein [Paracidovorax avenae]|uniref:baseplate J/gp47 family protein n=1 Tax=Paracidovorax avenae TaxID=80867 RepID=UPI001CEF8352|nr:baseplate J/gp47 family protein [Paracidovorax avenae]